MTEPRARYGWESGFPEFQSTPARVVRERLESFVSDASPEQVRAWQDYIPPLQREVGEVLVREAMASRYSAILEYELPMESRRPDAVLLLAGCVMVLELKGKTRPSLADLDQAAAYARDLRCYHRECADSPVEPVLVPTRASGYVGRDAGVHIAGPDVLDALIRELSRGRHGAPIPRERFLAESAYCPLPTLVQAARELFRTGELRRIERAHAATEPTIETITRIVHQAAITRSRHLVLVTGTPGAGKTLVGLRVVHAHYLDDLAVTRPDGKPTAPAVFLSGNGPLVDVLQYELSGAGGGGKTFVRGVKDYIKQYGRKGVMPPQHVIVFDEAQRAFDAHAVAKKQAGIQGLSEPDVLIGVANSIPEWCVVIGLIGGGQEIHVGEEGGIEQWRDAIVKSTRCREWTVHLPPGQAPRFDGAPFPLERREVLNLDTELRFHLASHVHAYVAELLRPAPPADVHEVAQKLSRDGFHLRISRSLEVCKRYLWDRYGTNPDARFGLIASSKDRDLVRYGVPNDFQSTKRVRYGPWYGDPAGAYSGRSCRELEVCVTEFGAQGLELDGTLLAWGTDLRMVDGRWSNALSRGYRKGANVKDPMQLRINAYRVLLTRGRDGCVVFVPDSPDLDETFAFLCSAGFRLLESPQSGS